VKLIFWARVRRRAPSWGGASDVREYNETYNGIEYKIYLNKKGEVQNVHPR